MTLETSILENLKKLPEAMQQNVFLYTEFLVNQITPHNNHPDAISKEPPKPRGGLGIWKDQVWIADDFDAPLKDFKEYME